MQTLSLKNDIHWIGSLDPDLRVFDIIMQTEFGTTYNSYLVQGSEKTALFETVKVKFFDQYIEKIKQYTSLDKLEYLIVDHTEPDHAGSVEKLLEVAPNLKIVGSETAIGFLKEITNKDFPSIAVTTGDELSLGNKTLSFYSVPFLHWPDSIYTYIHEDHTLITCDSFGSHYSFDEILFSKLEDKNDYLKALHYYFTAIFGPFKGYMRSAIEKIEPLQLDMICTGHGPVLDQNPREIVEIYKKWCVEENPNPRKKVVIPYVSAYGYTEEIAKIIQTEIQNDNRLDVAIYDMVYADLAEVFNEILWADAVLFGTPTINGDALKPMWDIVTSLSPIVHGGKIASSFGSFGWSGEGVPNIIQRLEQLRMKVVTGFTIQFKGSDKELEDAKKYAQQIIKSTLTGEVPFRKDIQVEQNLLTLNPSGDVKKWRCVICGEIYEGVYPPIQCPACGVGQDLFEEYIEEEITFESSATEKFVIVGNSAAGISAAEQIRKRNNVAEILIISSETILGYYRPALSKGFDGIDLQKDFFLKEEAWYQENDIQIMLGKSVEKILRKEKEIILNDSETIHYDKLILASGSDSAMPPILNNNLKHVFKLRTLQDIERISEASKSARNAVVVGGGVLGLEAAFELQRLGLDVTVVEIAARILPRQLDVHASELFEETLRNAGIKIYKNKAVQSFEGQDFVEKVKLDSDEVLDAQIVVLSAGIKPNKGLAQNAGLFTNRGIMVDSSMKTSDPSIFAAGDCAEYEGKNHGIWPIALDQGRIAGINAVGDSKEFVEKSYPITLHGDTFSVFSIGDIGIRNDLKYQFSVLHNPESGDYKKLVFHNNKFVGGILIGDLSKSNYLVSGMNSDVTISEMVKQVF